MSGTGARDSAVIGAYSERKASAEAEARRLDDRGALFANGRGVTFVGALALAVLAIFHKVPAWGWYAAAGSLLAYALLAWRHGRVIRDEERAKVRVALNERGIARLRGEWHAFPGKGERFLPPDHLYASDLDVFGQGSLFQLIDETATRSGEATLASWLLEGANADTVRERQEAVKELAPLLDFRQTLLVESRIVAREKVDPARFVAWCEGGPYLRSIRWARPLAVILPLATLALYVLGRLELIHHGAWWGGVLALLAVVAATRKPIAAFYEQIVLGERGFARFGDTLAVVEKQAFTSPLLRRLVEPLRAHDGHGASARLKRFSRAFGFAEARQSSQLHAVLNLLTLWDVHTMFALERWREENGRLVRPWFEALAELEALCSLAGFAHDHPGFAFPEIDPKGTRFIATGLGHPLLDDPVRNDVSLPGPRTALIVTGSNMSGKTTLLRAIGANAVLALAGAPVCANSLVLGELRVLTSMRVKDSLERGISYFYAEVQRIRAVLDAAKAAHGKALFLLDEILLGTNTRERQIASRELLRLLLETGAIGAVTTHDLALTSLAEVTWASVRNVHFRDQLVDGKMCFDYRMREGVVETTNALRVLAEAGIPLGEGTSVEA
ncbi:MAG: DNA mismatch repair protein MutS [Myxococcaceae bacterium]|nr:DNA mismatch repair protein MutS [Myxococcaceae bacterium]